VSKTILVVEDEAILLEAYVMILQNAGYNVVAARDGQEAIDFLEKTNPDLILLDLRMPRVDGIGLLRELRNNNKKIKSKIIVFSNLDSQHEINEAYSLGADRYILKAWASPKELLQLVEDTLA
jgi:CheY-like chemotaxis protein